MQCNIDQKGKTARMRGGIISLVIGIILSILTIINIIDGQIGWVMSIAAIFGGAFAIFEAKKGWCIIRAMGFKTPL